MKEGLVFHLGRIPLCAVCAVVPAGGPWNLLECRLSQQTVTRMACSQRHDRHIGTRQTEWHATSSLKSRIYAFQRSYWEPPKAAARSKHFESVWTSLSRQTWTWAVSH